MPNHVFLGRVKRDLLQKANDRGEIRSRNRIPSIHIHRKDYVEGDFRSGFGENLQISESSRNQTLKYKVELTLAEPLRGTEYEPHLD